MCCVPIPGTCPTNRSFPEIPPDAQLIAREYYLPLEPLLIYLPIIVHISSSLLKRLYLTYLTRRLPQLSTHLIAGYALVPLLLPHIVTHRLAPSSSAAPIANLSPSELGYEYVGGNLQQWPVWSGVTYLALVGVGVLHAGIGSMKVVSWLKRGKKGNVSVAGADAASDRTDITATSTTDQTPATTSAIEPADPSANLKTPKDDGLNAGLEQRRTNIPLRRKIGLRGMVVALLAVIAVGLWRIRKDSVGLSRATLRRYEAVYRSLPWGYLLV
jgi:hypothetical protein